MIVWKSIPNYENYYEANNKGMIRSLDRIVILKDKLGNDRPCKFRGKIIKSHLSHGLRSNIAPTLKVKLSKKGIVKSHNLHRLIASAFLGDLEEKEVNHIDGNRLNNNISNLELVTKLENIRHAFDNELIKTKKKIAKLDSKGNIIEIFESESTACRCLRITQGRIIKSMKENYKCQGFKWKYINL